MVNLPAKNRGALKKLSEAYPWPKRKPDLPFQLQGWFRKENRKMLLETIEEVQPSIIVELGSWKGLSCTFLCENSDALVIAIDHWMGSEEHQELYEEDLKTLYDQFVVNCWLLQDRIIPVREDTWQGLYTLGWHDIEPDVVYIDASHDEESVCEDVSNVLNLFPQTVVIGDDYNHESVRKGVAHALLKFPNTSLEIDHCAYRIKRNDSLSQV